VSQPCPFKCISEITVTPVQSMGGDHMVAAAARVSTSGEQALEFAKPECLDEIGGLIRYLMKHRHGTPFEHAAMTFFVHAPIFVFREWHRHRVGFSYNEESGRYKVLDPVFWVPKAARLTMVPKEFKPARPTFHMMSPEEHKFLVEELEDGYQEAYDRYLKLLQKGYSREASRVILPFGIYSSCWVTCNPRSLMHFLSLRTHEPEARFVSYPQAEIEEAAYACEVALEKGWPLTYQAFNDGGRVAP